MNETMGQIIRRLRKERNLTQEELAEQLNITYQAVSRWENGTGMPDISQIVPLATVFGVSTDVLFNVAGTNAAEEAEKIVREACAMEQYGKLETYLASYDHMREGLKTYPNNLILLVNCAGRGLSLCLPENDYLYAADRAAEIAAETERQAKLIISYAKNSSDIMRAHQILVFLYASQGKYELAREQAYRFPVRSDFTLFSHLARIDEKQGDLASVIAHLGEDNAYLLQALEDNLARLGNAYYANGQYEQTAALCETWFTVMEAMFGERFPSFHDFDSGDLYLLQAQAYLALEESDKAMDSVEKSVLFYLDKIAPTSKMRIAALYQNPPLLPHGMTEITVSTAVMKEKLMMKLNSPALDALHHSERFNVLYNRVNSL
ncbi:MAG: helix-turn-helix transcriptional regulator [Clostridia bacterium]|nr:helix-turn-helix transcriptional regulator [Clostridia bacterium]